MNMNDASPYPRDFRGYGGNPPDPQWPGNARVAVSLVVNVEAGSELSLVDGDERNESVYEIVEPVEGEPNFCLASHFDYGPRAAWTSHTTGVLWWGSRNGPTAASPGDRRSLAAFPHLDRLGMNFFGIQLNVRKRVGYCYR